MTPVIERAIKIALTTCEQVVKKDFALDHDENRLRAAAHHMVRNLTAGMAMITCRDHLLLSIKSNLKNFMVTLGRNLTPQQQEAIEMTVAVIGNDNVELACAFIQKKAVEKAIPEIDARLKSEYESRVFARKEGRRYCDAVALTYQAERMPEQIRLKVGGVTAQQSAVYEEFARNIPGFKPLSEREVMAVTPKPTATDIPASAAAPTSSAPMGSAQTPSAAAGTAGPAPNTTSDECVAILKEVLSKVEAFVQSCTTLPATPHMANLHALVEAMNRAKNSREPAAVAVLVDKAVENLLQGLTVQAQVDTESLARYRDANLLVLRAMADQRAYGQAWTSARVTHALIEAREDNNKYNLDAFDCLVHAGLVAIAEYDKHLAKAVSVGSDSTASSSSSSPSASSTAQATQFAMHLCKIYLVDERANAHVVDTDLIQTVDVLHKIATQSPHPPEGLAGLMDQIKMGGAERMDQQSSMAAMAAGPTAQLHSGIQQAREFEDPPGLLEKTEYLLREWVNAYHRPDAGKDSRQAFVVFVQLMNQHGILKTDDLITRFFRMSTQMCVDLCYRALAEQVIYQQDIEPTGTYYVANFCLLCLSFQATSPTLVRAKCFHTLDAYVRLITLLVKHSGETQNTITKVNLLNKVLGIVAGVLLIDHDVRNVEFQQVIWRWCGT